MQEDENLITIKKINAAIVAKFKEQRDLYNREVKDKIGLLKDVKNLIEANVHFLSLRQRILEDNHSLIENFEINNKKYKEIRSIEYKKISEDTQYRYQSTEKDKVVDGLPNVSNVKFRVDLINSQISFMRESLKTVDQILYAFKTRIDIHKILEGG